MPPKASEETEGLETETFSPLEIKSLPPREYKIVWANVVRYIILHSLAIYGLYRLLFFAKWYTFIWGMFLGLLFVQAVHIVIL